MKSVTLGEGQQFLLLQLFDGTPFVAAVSSSFPGWPAAPELVLDTWAAPLPATVSGDGLTAVWSWTAQQVAEICETRPMVVTLRDPGSHHAYASGTVHLGQVVKHGSPSSGEPPMGSLTVETFDGQVHIHYHSGEGSGSISDAQIAALLGDPGSATHAALTAALSSGGSVHLGEGSPPDLIVGAKVKDVYIDTTTGDLYQLGA